MASINSKITVELSEEDRQRLDALRGEIEQIKERLEALEDWYSAEIQRREC